MAEFCKCGSLVIEGRCSNKGCSFRAQEKATVEKAAPARKAGAQEKAPPKSARTRRASKCITYNLYEMQDKEGNNS